METTMASLNPAIQMVWRIKLGAVTTVAVLGILAYEVFHFFLGDPLLPFGILTGFVLTLGLSISALVPWLRYRFWRFDLQPEALYLERGILNRVRTIVPLRRIQHLDVSQDILEREFQLGKLIVHTAGTRSSEVVLPGLRLEDAERLRDAVKRYILEDAV